MCLLPVVKRQWLCKLIDKYLTSKQLLPFGLHDSKVWLTFQRIIFEVDRKGGKQHNTYRLILEPLAAWSLLNPWTFMVSKMSSPRLTWRVAVGDPQRPPSVLLLAALPSLSLSELLVVTSLPEVGSPSLLSPRRVSPRLSWQPSPLKVTLLRWCPYTGSLLGNHLPTFSSDESYKDGGPWLP